MCKHCYDTVTRSPDASQRVRQRREQVYTEWLAKIAKVPKNYKTLTEEQWLAACRHFNGCACCGSPSIDARGYFITFKEGGRYCDWNVIPVCERCAMRPRDNPNIFVVKNKRPARLTEIISYLEDKLNAAIKN